MTAWWSADSTPDVVPGQHRMSRAQAPKAISAPRKGLLTELACPDHLEDREIAVLKALGYDPVSTDDLCVATGLPAAELMQSLLMLEMEGLADAAPGGFQRVV